MNATRSRGDVAAGGDAASVGATSMVGGRAIRGLSPTPMAVIPPPLLLLIRGEVESADVDPGNRLPDRGTPEAATWETLHRALDHWDTLAIAGWIGPQGWVRPSGAVTSAPTDDGATSGPSTDATGRGPDQPSPAPSFSWRSPAVIAAGATLASTLGVVLFSLRRGDASAAARQETP